MSCSCSCPSTFKSFPAVSCSSSFDELVIVTKQINGIVCAILTKLCKRVAGTITIVLVDDTGLNLLSNDYRSIKISNIGGNPGTINGAVIPAGDVIEFEYPDNVDTPSLSIFGSSNPNEMRVEYTNYPVV